MKHKQNIFLLVAFVLQGMSLTAYDIKHLEKVNKGEMDLSGFDLQAAPLFGFDLSGRTMKGTNLTGADANFANFSDTDLEGATLTNLRGEKIKLIRANLDGANLERATMPYADLTDATVKDAVLKNANLESATVKGVDFTKVKSARYTNFHYVELSTEQEEFLKQRKIGAIKVGTYGELSAQERATRGDKKMQGAKLAEAVLVSLNLIAVDFTEAILTKANFDESNLSIAIRRGAQAQGASFDRAVLWGAILDGANLEGATFRGANLVNVTFFDANVAGADFRGAIGLTEEQIADLRERGAKVDEEVQRKGTLRERLRRGSTSRRPARRPVVSEPEPVHK